jgi:hypothetical protein
MKIEQTQAILEETRLSLNKEGELTARMKLAMHQISAETWLELETATGLTFGEDGSGEEVKFSVPEQEGGASLTIFESDESTGAQLPVTNIRGKLKLKEKELVIKCESPDRDGLSSVYRLTGQPLQIALTPMQEKLPLREKKDSKKGRGKRKEQS